ncbi:MULTISPECIES: 23S rRNA (pseudouridine(1915)-N(3))-methyltransferase RlmH [Prochlorococcus]|uniref:23S rRNA (pseudouridine(1915)-N(3))-methyltransferase RlmH n=1 Tax=Prochlorococcus TaxID=1218 RepID=UPI000533B36C|nr:MULTISPECIES: 23S rRNA (pseudouridine(1915)-N(3))-methyltransferase RlmH [Prochlorococcus]KGG12628.1 LSU m3Psi1915 methyltransferase RlmH ybeA [Prochlorococcus sp. MIT 0601]
MLNPSRYRVIAIGKIKKLWIKNGINIYLKRLPGLTVTELRDGDTKKETLAIKTSIKDGEILIALAEDGEKLTSIAFSEHLENIASQRIVFIIGGANGLSPEIKAMADYKISLSMLTFPHEIARLLLLEQLYRASTIIQGGPYHRH